MCSQTASRGKPTRPEFVIQLEEARAEWRRYPKVRLGGCNRQVQPNGVALEQLKQRIDVNPVCA